MKIDLSNRNAIIMGASEGIGYAIAKEFARCGANLLLISRRKELLVKVVLEFEHEFKNKYDFIAVDLADTFNLRNELYTKLQNFGTFHIVVNNSGGPKPGEAHNANIEDFENAFRTHLYAFQVVLKLVKPGMIQNSFGRIINITSIGAKQPIDNLGVSNTLRGAISSWAKTLSRELGKYGITVNNILPGFILTQRLISIIQTDAERNGTTFEEEMKNRHKLVPLGRIGKPEEIAYAATFLASEYAAYINGINLPVDGGFLSTL